MQRKLFLNTIELLCDYSKSQMKFIFPYLVITISRTYFIQANLPSNHQGNFKQNHFSLKFQISCQIPIHLKLRDMNQSPTSCKRQKQYFSAQKYLQKVMKTAQLNIIHFLIILSIHTSPKCCFSQDEIQYTEVETPSVGQKLIYDV